MSMSETADSGKPLCGFLLPETIVQADGSGPTLALSASGGRTVLVTLGVTRTIEQESLDLSVWGSADGADWGAKPLAAFPQKFYCGTYTLSVDLSARPEVKYLSVRWKLNRWGRGEPKPLFGLYVFGEQVSASALTAAGQ